MADKLHHRAIAGLGWRRDLPDPRDHLFSAPGPMLEALPESVDLTPSFPPYDQGPLGSCTANALAAAVQFDRMKASETPPFVPSRLFIYYNERLIEGSVATDSGAYLRDGCKSLATVGVCPEDEWPYDDTGPEFEGGPFPAGAPAATRPANRCYRDAERYVATSYQRLTQTLSQLQGCLASGYPFVFGFSVFASWYRQNPRPAVISLPSGDDPLVGGHAVLCVGYDNRSGLFKIRNSWGRDQGEDGYFYMPYAYLTNSNLSADFWVIRTIAN